MIRTWLIPNDPRRFSSWIKALHTGLVSILMTLCLASGAAGQSSDTSSGDDPTNVAAPPLPNPPRTLKDLPVIIPKQNTEKFEWRTATQEAWLYTGVMHTFRFVTEVGTRDTLNGP
jgi:hypothetical protein